MRKTLTFTGAALSSLHGALQDHSTYVLDASISALAERDASYAVTLGAPLNVNVANMYATHRSHSSHSSHRSHSSHYSGSGSSYTPPAPPRPTYTPPSTYRPPRVGHVPAPLDSRTNYLPACAAKAVARCRDILAWPAAGAHQCTPADQRSIAADDHASPSCLVFEGV